MTETRDEPPDVSQSVAERIVRCEDAIVVPPDKGLGNQTVQQSGVFDAAGEFVPYSITWRGRMQVTVPPVMPTSDRIGHLPGRWMFLGPLYGHFGHFLVESIGRIWAFDRLSDDIDGVLYLPKVQSRTGQVANIYRPLLHALGVTAPMVNVVDPVRVDVLYVPQQGFGMLQMIEGAPEFRDFVRAHAGRGIAPQGHERIYISRTALPAGRGSIVGETLLETRLAEEGYVPFHPQQHTFTEQVAAYKAATHVISIDASPLHLLALVGNSRQTVGIIARRDGNLEEMFARQIRAFQGAKAAPINVLTGNWTQGGTRRPSRGSWGEVDFSALWRALNEAELVSGRVPWPAMTAEDVLAEIDRISAIEGVRLHPYRGTRHQAHDDAG